MKHKHKWQEFKTDDVVTQLHCSCGKISYPNKFRKKKLRNGFGSSNRFLGNYETLKVIPRSKRTDKNCNALGIAKINEFKVKDKK